MVTFEGLITWTVLVTLVSSTTCYLFTKYGTVENIVLNVTDFSKEDICKMKGWIRWKF